MSDPLQNVLAELAGEGRHDSAGAFSLNWRKAREKLQKFQLTDPHRWVAHAVAAALAGGAEQVEVRTDSDDCVLTFSGEPFPAEQLEQLFAYLLSDLPDDPTGRIRELALAMNSAAALQPARLQLRSYGTRLELKGTELQVGPLEVPLAGNELALRERVSWRVVRQLVTRNKPETEILTRCCQQAPVRLNGVELRQAWRSGAPVTIQAGSLLQVEPAPFHREVAPEGCRSAVLALHPLGEGSGKLGVLRYGVLVCEKSLDLGGLQVDALVDSPALRLNVSQSDVLEDQHFAGLVAWLRGLVESVLTEMATRPEPAEEHVRMLKDASVRQFAGETFDPGWTGLRRVLLDVPLWRDHAGQPTSLRKAMEDYQLSGALWVTGQLWELPALYGQQVLQDEPWLEPIFPVRRDAGELMREARVAHERRQAWEEAPPDGPTLGSGLYLLRLPLQNGEIGFRAAATRPAVLICFKGERALGTVTDKLDLPPGIEVAVNEDRLTMDPSWTRPNRDEAWSSMMVGLENDLEGAYAALCAAQPAPEHARQLLLRRLAREDTRPLARAIEATPLFRSLDGERHSLASLRSWEKVPYLTAPPPAELHDEVSDALLLTTEDWTLLAHFLGETRLEDRSASLEPILREQEFLQRQPLELRRSHEGLAELDFEEGYLVLENRPAFGTRFDVEALYKGRLLERIHLDGPAFGTVRGRVEVEGRARPSPRFERVGRGRTELITWLQGKLEELALVYARKQPQAPGVLDYFCQMVEERGQESQDPMLRAACATPLLKSGGSLDDLFQGVREGRPPALLQKEKLLLSRLVGKAALEAPGEPAEKPEAGELPRLEEPYEAVFELPDPWKGKLGLTRQKVGHIHVPGRRPAQKRGRVPFEAALVEAPTGADWHRRLLDHVEQVALEHAADHPDYLFFLFGRLSATSLWPELLGVPVRGDVFGRSYPLEMLLNSPVEFLQPDQKAPASHPQGPLLRLGASQLAVWKELFALVPYRPPAVRLEDLYPGRKWLVRIRLEEPLEGELGVPYEGEAGEVRVQGPAGWSSHPLPDHRGCLGVVRGEVPNLLELLPLARVESELAACQPQDDPFFIARVRGWRDWRTLGLGLAGSPLAALPCLQEGTSAPHEVEEAPMSDYDRLSEALRQQMLRILGGDPELSKAVPSQIMFGVTPKGTFCHCTPDGRVTLNPSHALLQRLLEQPSAEDEYFYFLVSAVFSIINRARADIRDEHERDFHARLLAHLLKEDG